MRVVKDSAFGSGFGLKGRMAFMNITGYVGIV